MRRFPLWKHALVFALILLALLYALPTAYPKSPTVQVRATGGSADSSVQILDRVRVALRKDGLKPNRIVMENGVVQAAFTDSEQQIAARASLAKALGGDYVVALNSISDQPEWLKKIGATPLALGLDLRGGVYFLLQVDIELAYERRLRGIVGVLKNDLRETGLTNVTLEDGVIMLETPSLKSAEEALDLILRRFTDLEAPLEAATSMVFSLSDNAADEILDLTMQQNLQTLRNRVDELGVAEPVITRQGKDRIAVQLPGVQDTAQAKEVLGRTAALELRAVDDKSNSRAAIRRAKKGRPPAGTELFYQRDGEPLLLKEEIVISGENISDARPSFDNNNRPAVHIALDSVGANKIKAHTRPRIGKRLAILLRDKNTAEVISAPVIQQELYANFIIHGRMDSREAAELSLLLRAGALAAPLEIVEERTVGPSLGADNIKRGISSVIGGFAAIALFIILYYSVFGLISVTALLGNLLLLTALLGGIGATLTLPGLAGFALTLGMAIDANVLINERIREEIDAGKSPLTAIDAGYGARFYHYFGFQPDNLNRRFSAFCLWLGAGARFCRSVVFGYLTSMFSSIQTSRSMVNLAYERGRPQRLSLGLRLLNLKRVLPLMQWRRFSATLSSIFVLICVISLAYQGLNFGVDFTGGSVMEVQFQKTPAIAEVRTAIAQAGLENSPIQQSGDGIILIKAPPVEAGGANLSEEVLNALRTLDPQAAFRRVEFVGPQVSEELFLYGALALFFVLFGIAAYLSFRFKWRMAVGAILANLHDIIFILGLFSLFQWEFSLPVLAAVLAILGYSVNESVVIFDRVREIARNSRGMDDSEEIVNTAISQTWARTIITHGSTQLAVLAMLFFGGEALFLFALALTIGIFSSIYSSVLIAGPTALRLGMTREDFIVKDNGKADNPAGAVV